MRRNNNPVEIAKKNVEVTKKTKRTREKNEVKKTADKRVIIVRVILSLVIVLLIALVTIIFAHDKIEDYLFNSKLKKYVKINYNMDLDIKNIEFAPVTYGLDVGNYWNYEFYSKKYPDIKVTGILQYVKMPEQLKLNIEDIEYANKVKNKLENDLNLKNVEIKTVRYSGGEYTFSYTAGTDKSEKTGYSASKETPIVLNKTTSDNITESNEDEAELNALEEINKEINN